MILGFEVVSLTSFGCLNAVDLVDSNILGFTPMKVQTPLDVGLTEVRCFLDLCQYEVVEYLVSHSLYSVHHSEMMTMFQGLYEEKNQVNILLNKCLSIGFRYLSYKFRLRDMICNWFKFRDMICRGPGSGTWSAIGSGSRTWFASGSSSGTWDANA